MYNEETMSKRRKQRKEQLPFTESQTFCTWEERLNQKIYTLELQVKSLRFRQLMCFYHHHTAKQVTEFG